MSALDLDALDALATAARPGPWAWFGNTRMTDVYLATVRGGRNYVMDFVRWGMRGAQPRFNVGGIMRTTKELSTGECFAIDHPDARFIAAMDPTTALALITRLRAAEARTAWQPIETAPPLEEGALGPWVQVWGVRFGRRKPDVHLARLDGIGWGDRDGNSVRPLLWAPAMDAPLPAAPGAP